MKTEHDLKRLTRIVRLLNILSEGELIITETARDLEVCVRTIQRDIRTIEDAGFPIYNEKPGRLRFAEGFSLKKMKLSNEEASMLVLMADIIKPLGSRFDNSFQNIKNKLFNSEEESPFYVKMPKGLKYETNAITTVLEKGIETKTWIKMTLAHDPAKKLLYLLCPLKLLNYEGFWYLLGTNAHDQMRKFRLEKILDAENTAKTFKVAKNIKKILDQSTNVWFMEERRKKIVVKVSADIAPYFKTKQILPLQKIIKEDKSGALTIESMISQNIEAVRIIQQWLPGITVVSPNDLKEDMKKLLQEALCRI